MTPDIAQLVPHRGAMSLLDSVAAHGADWIEALARVPADGLFTERGVVGAWVGIEYMAQAVAAYSGLRAHAAGESPRVGLLAGTRAYRASVDGFASGTLLRVRASRRFESDSGLASFECSIRDESGELLAEAALTVYQPSGASTPDGSGIA